MGGEHRCPVCSSTFTRPQHVARHMRSHTGDRPYKCQHCGDQFARSDLLSRHVNKCHASEKPPTTTVPSRKKGQAGPSSTRATSSKQACDQCVVATLPCDGCNPCGKCVQRKSACTYVKFQRQTAPSGPGHKHNASVDSLSSTTSSLSSFPRADDLFLAQPPMSVPSMGPSDLYYANIGADRQLHQQPAVYNPHQVTTGWDGTFDSQALPSLTFSTSAVPPVDLSYRMQPDLLRRAAMLPPPHPATNGQNIAPGLYAPNHTQTNQWTSADHGLLQDSNGNVDQGHGAYNAQQMLSQHHEQQPSSYLNNSNYGGPHAEYPSHESNNFAYQAPGNDSGNGRRGSLGGLSDTSATSHASSNVSFDFNAYALGGGDQVPHGPPSRDGRLALPFGSMSLDDASAYGIYTNANLASAQNNLHQANTLSDGSAPFFSGAAMKMAPSEATPRPNQTMSAREREAETRELREFWKQYLRTPLTGPPLGMTPNAENASIQFGMATNGMVAKGNPHSGFASPNGDKPPLKRGLSRVASLPSVRTPSEEKMPMGGLRFGLSSNNNNSISHILNGSSYQSNRDANNDYNDGGRARSARETDDLKSYEEALLARKANMNFNLSFAPKKDRVRRAAASSLSPEMGNSNAVSSEGIASTSSSPAVIHAQQQQNRNQQQVGRSMGMLQVPNQDAGSGSGSDDGGLRPGFKRLPSQTLEPSHAKRHLYRWGTEEAVEDTDSDVDSNYARPSDGYVYGPRSSRSGSVATFSEASGGGSGASSQNGSPYLGNTLSIHGGPMNTTAPNSSLRTGVPSMAAYKVPEMTQVMMDRYRRQSAPTGTRPNVSNFAPDLSNAMGLQQMPTSANPGVVGSD